MNNKTTISSKDVQFQDSTLIVNNLIANSISSPIFSGTAEYANNANNLDNLNSTQFLRSDVDDIFNGTLTITGALKCPKLLGTATDSHKLNGLDSSQFLRSDIDVTLDGDLLTKGKIIADSFIGTSTNSDNINGLNSSQFLRSDADNYIKTNTTIQGKLNINNEGISEIYTTNENIEIGEIVCIGSDETQEIQRCSKGDAPFGVVTKTSGITLCKKDRGIMISIIGKTYIKIKGPVKKGQPITIYDNGIGISCDYNVPYHMIIGKSLESCKDTEIKLIKCVIKV